MSYSLIGYDFHKNGSFYRSGYHYVFRSENGDICTRWLYISINHPEPLRFRSKRLAGQFIKNNYSSIDTTNNSYDIVNTQEILLFLAEHKLRGIWNIV